MRIKPGSVFVCQRCERRFTEEDFGKLRFFPSTGICRVCYIEAMGDGSVCFGKREYLDVEKTACKRVCPDRFVCRLFVKLEELL